ncbi:MAG: hypothetical protein AAB897_01780 [Patescibacteria group bacterium]
MATTMVESRQQPHLFRFKPEVPTSYSFGAPCEGCGLLMGSAEHRFPLESGGTGHKTCK